MLRNRRQLINLAMKSSIIAKRIIKLRKLLHKYPLWLSEVYKDCCIIAEKKRVKIPKPKINMEVEKWTQEKN
jgi:hypothetical protein